VIGGFADLVILAIVGARELVGVIGGRNPAVGLDGLGFKCLEGEELRVRESYHQNVRVN
jgi:hypothetical protein